MDDLGDGHAADPMSKDCIGQGLRSFGFVSFEHSDLGGFVSERENEFVVSIGNERAMDVQMHCGIGDLGQFLCVLKHLAVAAGLRVCGDVLSHAQPAVVFLQFLHLVSDWYIRMSLLEVADDRLPVFEGEV